MSSQGGILQSLLLVKRTDGCFLLTKNSENEEWWIPSKMLCPDETFRQAAESAAKVPTNLRTFVLTVRKLYFLMHLSVDTVQL